jgi:hypothetical protein
MIDPIGTSGLVAISFLVSKAARPAFRSSIHEAETGIETTAGRRNSVNAHFAKWQFVE